MSLFKAVTIGNAFLLARRHDTSPHVELLRYLELNLQVGSAIAELSIFIHYTSPQASFSACFAETCALLHSKKNSFFKLRGNACFFTFLLFGNSTSKQWSLWRSQLNLEKKVLQNPWALHKRLIKEITVLLQCQSGHLNHPYCFIHWRTFHRTAKQISFRCQDYLDASPEEWVQNTCYESVLV